MDEAVAAEGVMSPGAKRTRATRAVGLRRSAFLALIAVLLQYGLGIGVNLYAAVPAADHGATMGKVFKNGPAVLTAHVIVGLLLILAALAVLIAAIVARQLRVVALSLVALAALVFAAMEGSSFVDKGHPGASLGMALATGVAILCYGTVLFLDLSAAPGRSGGER